MQRAIWIIALIAFFVWSALAWLGNIMLGWLTEFTAANAGQLTVGGELSGWLSWAAALADAAGGALIAIIWLFGGVAIAVAAFVISRLAQWHNGAQRSRPYKTLPPGWRR
ncbi:hypothetical protein [Ferrovibrio sp.]|jgi:hypothetical protein|uniref:hypothetical protein n=1 Tax=Ferrovibrio sp. TaxID=1917215 RepID=UPI0035B3BA62